MYLLHQCYVHMYVHTCMEKTTFVITSLCIHYFKICGSQCDKCLLMHSLLLKHQILLHRHLDQWNVSVVHLHLQHSPSASYSPCTSHILWSIQHVVILAGIFSTSASILLSNHLHLAYTKRHFQPLCKLYRCDDYMPFAPLRDCHSEEMASIATYVCTWK